ncbi:capsular biosynthesis protein [Lottiidibacillus patelloidae]|uniref:non-specific protein-tyrosine kinase n=1 Tax=Lottiidibacillus patelloidae TaxID=2670334 RepID=A0A263BS50_9BACI|nr:CpsD/CapB family tyrosine-protein kinase [Lottiidibacillus patelloidae]OZM56398.1 capsular biosynthesis protein [Lottiidibacillus patelloidae]
MARKVKNSRKSLLQTGNRSIITHRSPKSSVSEQYRTLRTNIEFAAVDESLRTFMVTSANPSEGKSTTVANLAVVFAQQDKKVLLVDADMRRPTVHYTFRTDNIKGLTNYLTKQATLEEVVCETEVNNLQIISCGPIPPNPAELLSSKAMDLFIEEALQMFDIVIFDTPPVLAVTDAQVLANKVQGVVLVVNSGRTETESALKTKDLLTNAKAKLLGVVLNEKKQKQGEYYYYYGRR